MPLYEGGDLLCAQVVELDGLAGGELQPAHLLPLHRPGQKVQPLQVQPPAGQPQAQHVPGGVPLGIGAHAAGHALVGPSVQLPPVKGGDGLLKAVDLPAEGVFPLLVHEMLSPFHSVCAAENGANISQIVYQERSRSTTPICEAPRRGRHIINLKKFHKTY